MKLLLQALVCTGLLSIVGCKTAKTKSKDEQARDFYDSHLNSPAAKACNDAGNFYELAKEECHKDIKLVSWRCAREGLESHVVSGDTIEGKFNSEVLKTMDMRIESGFQINQCGESEDGYTIVELIRKQTTGNSANLEMVVSQMFTAQ